MPDKFIIREYQRSDKEAIIYLLRLNTPKFFSPDEEKDLIYYLDHQLQYYAVLEKDKQLIGCGGINFADQGTTGVISWDILHPDHQGKGFGKLLLSHRLDKLKADTEIRKIVVRTSQLTYPFYEKSGFRLVEKVNDYWAPGFDLYRMEQQV